MFYIVFDLAMAVVMFLFGVLFYESEGKAARFLSGYNLKTERERKKYDESAMCRAYGKRMMGMAIPFLVGADIDARHQGAGCLLAWMLWTVMFVLLFGDRHRREQ